MSNGNGQSKCGTCGADISSGNECADCKKAREALERDL